MTIEMTTSDGALVERLRQLRTALPAMANEVAVARREGNRLRRENAALLSRLAALEDIAAAAAAPLSTGKAAVERELI